MSPDPDCGLIIFLRSPVPGKVKTRIASRIGDLAALDIYKELTAFTLDLASGVTLPVYLFYEGPFPETKNPSFHYLNQIPDDLGQKMQSAFNYVLERHDMAIIIGSDCPELSIDEIQTASEKLKVNDFVIGPTEDGGYYLLGLKKAEPDLFENIEWSTQTVFEETKKRIIEMGKSYLVMRTLYDVDTVEDWNRYRKNKT